MGHIALLSRKPIYYAVLCSFVAVCSSVVFFGRPVLASQLHAWKVLPRPERFTELYFTGHTRLPETFKPDTPQGIAFTVHNLEHQVTSYHFLIVARAGDKKQVLAEGQFALAQDTSKRITRDALVPALDSRVAVEVQLEYRGITLGQDKPSLETQAIHYWVNQAANPLRGKEGGHERS